jgi:hypothetical protein
VTLTVNPSAVFTGAENVGVNATPGRAAPTTVAEPETYPARDVDTLTVDDTPGATPVTVNGNTAPLGVPSVTIPVLPQGMDGVKVYNAL